MTEKRKTRNELAAALADERKARQTTEADLQTVRGREKQTRAEIDDLKVRLANAESECQRMRGYIDRVQEDDVVREDLIATGDPAGEQRLVPKRRPTTFCARSEYSKSGLDIGDDTGVYSPYRDRDRPKPKHWVTY